jgi:hypothetical protein
VPPPTAPTRASRARPGSAAATPPAAPFRLAGSVSHARREEPLGRPARERTGQNRGRLTKWLPKFNPKSKWTKQTHARRAYYIGDADEDGHREYTLKKPEDDVSREGVSKEEECTGWWSCFDRNWALAQRLDALRAAGELVSGGSPWIKVCYGKLAFYARYDYHGNHEFSMKVPAEGVCGIEGQDTRYWACATEAKFRECMALAEKMDAGELNYKSYWHMYTHDSRVYYCNSETDVYSLVAPAEGVSRKLMTNAADFEQDWTRAAAMDTQPALDPRSTWIQYRECSGGRYRTWGCNRSVFEDTAIAGRPIFSRMPPIGVRIVHQLSPAADRDKLALHLRSKADEQHESFFELWKLAGKTDADIVAGLNPRSCWAEYWCDGRSSVGRERKYYYNFRSQVFTLIPPPNGVFKEFPHGRLKEKWSEDEKFERRFATRFDLAEERDNSRALHMGKTENWLDLMENAIMVTVASFLDIKELGRLSCVSRRFSTKCISAKCSATATALPKMNIAEAVAKMAVDARLQCERDQCPQQVNVSWLRRLWDVQHLIVFQMNCKREGYSPWDSATLALVGGSPMTVGNGGGLHYVQFECLTGDVPKSIGVARLDSLQRYGDYWTISPFGSVGCDHNGISSSLFPVERRPLGDDSIIRQGDTLGLLLDCGKGCLVYYKNNVLQAIIGGLYGELCWIAKASTSSVRIVAQPPPSGARFAIIDRANSVVDSRRLTRTPIWSDPILFMP